jgi:2-isopropylmalate synthase
VRLRHCDGEKLEEATVGDGPINAAFNAIDKIVGEKFKLAEYKLEAVTEGKDALGEVKVRIQKEGRLYSGRGLSTDIIEASILSYLSAINNMLNSAAAIMEEAILNR